MTRYLLVALFVVAPFCNTAAAAPPQELFDRLLAEKPSLPEEDRVEDPKELARFFKGNMPVVDAQTVSWEGEYVDQDGYDFSLRTIWSKAGFVFVHSQASVPRLQGGLRFSWNKKRFYRSFVPARGTQSVALFIGQKVGGIHHVGVCPRTLTIDKKAGAEYAPTNWTLQRQLVEGSAQAEGYVFGGTQPAQVSIALESSSAFMEPLEKYRTLTGRNPKVSLRYVPGRKVSFVPYVAGEPQGIKAVISATLPSGYRRTVERQSYLTIYPVDLKESTFAMIEKKRVAILPGACFLFEKKEQITVRFSEETPPRVVE